MFIHIYLISLNLVIGLGVYFLPIPPEYTTYFQFSSFDFAAKANVTHVCDAIRFTVCAKNSGLYSLIFVTISSVNIFLISVCSAFASGSRKVIDSLQVYSWRKEEFIKDLSNQITVSFWLCVVTFFATLLIQINVRISGEDVIILNERAQEFFGAFWFICFIISNGWFFAQLLVLIDSRRVKTNLTENIIS